ncbi:hypothetical protein [Dialister invisus]|uniref:hypothetical protein n=1 Tax=Dialister invisus TaxID=218538 RepID=UPI0027BADB8C|nr:hypothetical protein [Dialister invisus]
MDKLKIIRPNGEEEIAELTTDKSLVGNNYLKLDIGGVPHYAKVGDVIDTHMYVFNGVDGKKYYIKKKIGNVENPPSGGDSPTLDIRGTLTLTESDGNMLIATSDKINTASGGYQVSKVEIGNDGEIALIDLTVDGISDFYKKPGIYTTTIIKIKLGDVTFDAMRDSIEVISGNISYEDFQRLKANVGTPINFSIKYE